MKFSQTMCPTEDTIPIVFRPDPTTQKRLLNTQIEKIGPLEILIFGVHVFAINVYHRNDEIYYGLLFRLFQIVWLQHFVIENFRLRIQFMLLNRKALVLPFFFTSATPGIQYISAILYVSISYITQCELSQRLIHIAIYFHKFILPQFMYVYAKKV